MCMRVCVCVCFCVCIVQGQNAAESRLCFIPLGRVCARARASVTTPSSGGVECRFPPSPPVCRLAVWRLRLCGSFSRRYQVRLVVRAAVSGSPHVSTNGKRTIHIFLFFPGSYPLQRAKRYFVNFSKTLRRRRRCCRRSVSPYRTSYNDFPFLWPVRFVIVAAAINCRSAGSPTRSPHTPVGNNNYYYSNNCRRLWRESRTLFVVI